MSARRGVEQAKSATAAQTSLRVKIQRGTALGNDDGMQAVWRQGGGKPIAREGCQYRYPGSRTSSVGELAMQTRAVFLFSMRGSSVMNQEDGFGAASRASQQVNLEIRSSLTAPSPGNTLAYAVQQGMAWARST